MMLSVIIPVFNEEQTIVEVVKRVMAVPVWKEILVVDDCSTDRTLELLRSMTGIKLFVHHQNQGKGAAIQTGLKHACGDVVVIQDADLEYNPTDYLDLLVPFADNRVDAVFGSRFKGKGKFLIHSRIANILLTIFTNALFGGHITDMETCYKLIRRRIILNLNLSGKRFEIEPEITVKLLRHHCKIVEVPIRYSARTTGKKISWKDGFNAVYTLLKWYVS